ncbi:hypothetical protein AVEN_110027-1 [Araneus ventricosus]|uniref:Uncharacterized protein n=1 Tax=Araneus ventricosus TaxID=182803 RepID=A0A4Y2H2R6_ARAVE|nr:hypothetical protein AVEN_110027-1 [Araneus ventricosus]
MECFRTFKRIFFPDRDIEERVAFSGIIELPPRSENLSPKCSLRSGIQAHPMLTPVELFSQHKTCQAGKRHYIFATILKLPDTRKSNSPSKNNLIFKSIWGDRERCLKGENSSVGAPRPSAKFRMNALQ